MRIVAQRVIEANVKVDGEVIGKCGKGMMLLVSFTDTDTVNEIDYMVNKVSNLRIFDDENGIMNLSIKDVHGEILSISQFTLYGDARKGNRPSYVKALNGEKAVLLYDMFNKKMNEIIHTETGKFGADMKVSLINDGPVTILLEK